MPAPKSNAKDPIQQQLRTHKREWSDEASDFISKLIAFKKGLNGRGDTSIGVAPSSIKDPLPSQLAGTLSNLTSEFQEIVSGASGIISEQASYSKSRKKKQLHNPKSPPPSVPSTVAENPIEQALGKGASLQVHAGIGDFVKSLFTKEEFHQERLNMLSNALGLKDDLRDLENEVLTLDNENVPNLVMQLKLVKSNFEEIKKGAALIHTNKSQAPNAEPTTEEKPIEIKPTPSTPKSPATKPKDDVVVIDVSNDERVQKFKTNLHKLFNENIAKDEILAINSLIEHYKNESDPQLKNQWFDRVKENYNSMLIALRKKIKDEQGIAPKTIEEVISAIKQSKIANQINNDLLTKNGYNAVSRFLRRQLMRFLSTDRSARPRLVASNTIISLKKTLKELISVLKVKKIDIEKINSLIEQIDKKLPSLDAPLNTLTSIYKNKHLQELIKKKREQSVNDKTNYVDRALQQNFSKELLK